MKRILVVEDEASIRELVALNLKMTGWEVLEAPSAERALELIQKNPPCDVALLDIMLPGMDGFSLCETIRHGDPYIRSAAFPSARMITSPSRSRCRS